MQSGNTSRYSSDNTLPRNLDKPWSSEFLSTCISTLFSIYFGFLAYSQQRNASCTLQRRHGKTGAVNARMRSMALRLQVRRSALSACM